MPAADAEAERPVESAASRVRQRLERHAGLAGPAVGQADQVLREAEAAVFRASVPTHITPFIGIVAEP